MKILFALLILIPALARGEESTGGITVRGGGDDLALEFTQAYADALAKIEKKFPDLLAGQDLTALSALPEKSKVLITDDELPVPTGKGSQNSVAANDPSTNTIWVNRARWQKVSRWRLQQAIALHEFLSLAGLEGTGRYPISSAYLERHRLPSDEEVIVRGNDVVDPLINLEKVTCDQTYTPPTKKSSYSSANASWILGRRIYNISGVFQFGEQPPRLTFSQSIDELEWVKGSTRLEKKLQLRGIWSFRGKPQGMDLVKKPKYVLIEETDDDRHLKWEWKDGKKGNLLSQSAETQIGEEHSRVQGKQEDGTSDCIHQTVANTEWFALLGQTSIASVIEDLNVLALRYTEAARAFESCRDSDSAKCTEAQSGVDQAQKRFDQTWDLIYRKRLGKK